MTNPWGESTMQKFLMATCAVVAWAGTTLAQAPAVTTMPGTTVGSYSAKPILKPAGERVGTATPQAGTPITGLSSAKSGAIGPGALGGEKPQGKEIDMKNVIAPYPNMPKEATYWEKLEERWFALFESDTPAVRQNYTPGIARRNKQRAAERKKMWWEAQ
jgi:hypothetical protein